MHEDKLHASQAHYHQRGIAMAVPIAVQDGACGDFRGLGSMGAHRSRAVVRARGAWCAHGQAPALAWLYARCHVRELPPALCDVDVAGKWLMAS